MYDDVTHGQSADQLVFPSAAEMPPPFSGCVNALCNGCESSLQTWKRGTEQTGDGVA